jgi:heme/copper-type cytochrome/quinol oxidase subunit 2
MPIAIQAVSKAQFERWLEEAKTKFAADEPARALHIAAAE